MSKYDPIWSNYLPNISILIQEAVASQSITELPLNGPLFLQEGSRAKYDFTLCIEHGVLRSSVSSNVIAKSLFEALSGANGPSTLIGQHKIKIRLTPGFKLKIGTHPIRAKAVKILDDIDDEAPLMNDVTLKTIFDNKKQTIGKNGNTLAGFCEATFERFRTWFNQEVFNKGCYYCGLTNEQTFRLYQMQRRGERVDGTRGGKRSRRLELDRKNPILPYDDLDNIVWSCYWCNNSKSNFFTETEFKPISEAIGTALRKILSNSEN